ncbi:hypothetical protein BBJ28_00022297 [Nothophytophthora sp. Chile5]|nr:hypothetical protein BBJ28_00022297 [Nothophytophthora sp. Chile5]
MPKSGERVEGADGFPIILAGLFLLLSPFVVECPAWLLMTNRREEAKQVITRLYGEENVSLTLAWLETTQRNEEEGGCAPSETNRDTKPQDSPLAMLFSPTYSRQMAAAGIISCGQQLSGINAVFYYSSGMLRTAGITEDRVGSVIVEVVNVLPTFFSGL